MSTQRSLVIVDLSSSMKDRGRVDFEPNVRANRRLQEFCEEVTATPIDAIVRECNRRVKTILPIDAQCISHKTHKSKNRYPDIFCLDATRVVLRDSEGQPRQEGDYIHASYVSSDELRKCYILTQGPKNNTINDFWHMVWQVQCPVIIMLCDFIENGKSKCMKYLPRSNCELSVGEFLVRKSGSTLHSQGMLIENKITLIKQWSGKQLHVKHWRWIGWPDHSVPDDFQTVFRILRECRRTDLPIIHCSAGVGRSGTLIALEVCLGVLRNGKTLNVKNCVETVRRQRAQSVQNGMQCLFIHRALLEMAGLNEFIDQRRLKGFRLTYDRVVKHKSAISSEGAAGNNNKRRSHGE